MTYDPTPKPAPRAPATPPTSTPAGSSAVTPSTVRPSAVTPAKPATDAEAAPPEPFRTPETDRLEAQLAFARLELAETLSELASQLTPRAQAERAKAAASGLLHDAVAPDASPEARKRSRIVLGVAAGVVLLFVAGTVRGRRGRH
jgi:hypothetical protein